MFGASFRGWQTSLNSNVQQGSRPFRCLSPFKPFQCGRAMQQPHLGVRSDELGRTSVIDPTKHEDLPTLCLRLHARVNAFIAADAPSTGFLRSTQEQTRTSLRVIEEALDRYRFVRSSSDNSCRIAGNVEEDKLIEFAAWNNCRSLTMEGKIALCFSFFFSPHCIQKASPQAVLPFNQSLSSPSIRLLKLTIL